jgi:hypothetical protein
MDSGPNHLNDISLDPQYAGICGFTLDEFGPLFADRMEPTLARLKEAGKMKPSAGPLDLRAEIFDWYDGYNWGGQTRILNPYSILNFFENKSFGDYWITSGRPGHLTALIQARPMDFLVPKLESYLSVEVRKSELTQLDAVPVLFHSGYLTLDKISTLQETDLVTKETKIVDSYSFRLPTFEVSSYYHRDCFAAIFRLDSIGKLKTKGDELSKAILAKNAETVGDIFSGYVMAISYYQRPDEEKGFHAFIHLILMSMGFDVASEMPGYANRLDLCLKLPGRVYAIIELKYSSGKIKLTDNQKNNSLANWGLSNLDPETKAHALAEAVRNKLPFEDIMRVLSETTENILDNSRQDVTLAANATKLLTYDEMMLALAKAAKATLTKVEMDKILLEATVSQAPSTGEIDDLLSKAAKQALLDIDERKYHSTLKHKANEIIDLGLAVHGADGRVKALFGPSWKAN